MRTVRWPIRSICVLALTAALWCDTAMGKIGTIDAVPAATLLLPYFEVDLSSSTGPTTVFTVINGGAAPVIAHICLWTDRGVPTYNFDVTLTGYDVQPVNLRDLFEKNAAGIDFSGVPDRVIYSHTGQPVDPNAQPAECAGRDFGDNHARGYVTIDTTNTNTTLFPGDPGYFVSGGNGIAINLNVLWGEYSYIDLDNNFAQGEQMVHIEASSSDALVTTNGNYTFYGGLVGGDASDNREPLNTAWSVPYKTGGMDSEGTDIIYWRDPKEPVTASEGLCFPSTGLFPLANAETVVFDDAENAQVIQNSFVFPAVCGRLRVGDPDLQPAFDSGWIYFETDYPSSGTLFGTRGQSWVTVVSSALGRFSSGFHATAMKNATQP